MGKRDIPQPVTLPRSSHDVRVGDPVRTPSGRPAVVLAVYDSSREATVLRLDDGERVRFRCSKLVIVGPLK